MTMVAWSVYLPAVQPEVPLCPRPVIIKAIRDAAIVFCERTKVWKEISESYPIGGGLSQYDFEPPTYSVVHWIEAAELENGYDLDIKTHHELDEIYPGWKGGSLSSGTPCAITQLDPRTFYLVPAPSTASTIILTHGLKPTRSATKGPDWLHEEYEPTIASGALARLMAMVGKSWSNGAASIHAAAFQDQTLRATSRVGKAFGRAPIRVRAQFL